MAVCLVVWVDWIADEWGWVRADRLTVMNAGGRVALNQAASDQMHGRLAMKLAPTGPEAGDQITISIFVDGTAVEFFSSSGKAASTRMYWETDQTATSVQLSVLSRGGMTAVKGSAWGMDSIWESRL